MRFNDALSGLAFVALAAFGLLLVARFPDYPGERFGPGLFPSLTLSIMLLCGVLLTARGARRWREEPVLALAAWARRTSSFVTLALIAAGILFYILFAQRLGFVPTGFVVCFGLLLWMRGPRLWLRSALVAAGAVLVIFLVFGRILRVPLPLGILTNLLY